MCSWSDRQLLLQLVCERIDVCSLVRLCPALGHVVSSIKVYGLGRARQSLCLPDAHTAARA